MKSFERYTVTAALPYANGPKHIGHLAGAYIPADVYVRYLRSSGRNVIFVCGSDEHGTAIPNQALKEHTTPKAIIDKYHALIRDCFSKIGISFDIYHRTSEPIHHQTAQEIFLTLYNKKLLEEKETEQYYDEKAGVFLADRYIVGTCPKCGHPNAYGDQCEKCGSSLSPEELINPRSTLSGNKPVLRPTRHWYLPLNQYEGWLRDWILDSHRDDWKPNVYGQCKSWIEGGLQPRAMTRDLDWGIKVPLPDADGKVLYVWFDAPIGYISATRALFQELSDGKFNFATPRSDFRKPHADDWKKYWQDKNTKLVHFIGKDNIVFHCIIFPVVLHAHQDFILPQNVPANEFMNLEGDKMSTSRGWSIEMHEFLEDFPDKVDVLRYVLLTNLPETKDSEFTWKDFQAKNNNELVAIFGNFVNRAIVLSSKNFDNKVPKRGKLTEVDKEVIGQLSDFPVAIANSIEQYRFREATALLMNLARLGNKYLADTEPWKLVKTDPGRVATVLNVSLQIAANLSILARPFMPYSADKLKEMLSGEEWDWKKAGSIDLLPEHLPLGTPSLLFDKVEDEVVDRQVEKLKLKAQGEGAAAHGREEINFETFEKIELKVGKVLEAAKVEKSKKLLKLRIDIGTEVRTILSGIAEYYTPEQMTGKQVVIVANLAPRKIMGIESQGMVLMAEDDKGTLALIQPIAEVNPGSEVR